MKRCVPSAPSMQENHLSIQRHGRRLTVRQPWSYLLCNIVNDDTLFTAKEREQLDHNTDAVFAVGM